MNDQFLSRLVDSYIGEVRDLNLRQHFGAQLDKGKVFKDTADYLVHTLKRALEVADKITDQSRDTKASLRAQALFQMGRVWYFVSQVDDRSSTKYLNEAKTLFEQSLQSLPAQAACYNLALCLDALTPGPHVVDAYMQAVKMNPDTDIAILAAKKIV